MIYIIEPSSVAKGDDTRSPRSQLAAQQAAIMTEGSAGSEMYIVLEGLVQLTADGAELGKMRGHDGHGRYYMYTRQT